MSKAVYNYNTETYVCLNNLITTINKSNKNKVTEEEKRWQMCFNENNVEMTDKVDINIKMDVTDNIKKSVDLEKIVIIEHLSNEDQLTSVVTKANLSENKDELEEDINKSLQLLADYSADILNNKIEYPMNTFFDLYKSVTEHELELIMKHLQKKLNIEAISSLCQLISEVDFANIQIFVRILASEILLRKLKFSQISISFVKSVKLLINLFPEIVIQITLTPILLEPESSINLSTYKEIIQCMSPVQKQMLLSYFLGDSSRNLVSPQITILEKLIYEAQNPKTVEELISLMHKSRFDLAKDISFGRLLFTVAQFLDKRNENMYTIDQNLFVQTVQCNETLFKKRAQKALGLNE